MPKDQMPPKRVATALFNALSAGVTPRVGIEYIVVGRKHEISALLADLDNVKEGGASFRILLGRYGSGKSFLLQLMRANAMERNFVVADADMSPERRLAGTSGQGVATYRELIRNLATRTRPDGGALAVVLERWIGSLQSQVIGDTGVKPTDPGLTDLVEARIFQATRALEELVNGFDFAKVVASYWRGYREDQDALKASAIRWLRAEYTTKTEARQDLGVRVIIDDDNWYDYLKLMAEFVRLIGYQGLVVMLDEAVNLYKITHTVSRHSNYEKLLTILNDTLQGRASGLGIIIGGTPQFLEDTRRGLFSYDALRTRLSGSRFSRDGLVDMSSPVIPLQSLSPEEIFLLLQRIRELHAHRYDYQASVQDTEIITFMEEVLNQLGAKEFLTPRDVIRDFVSVLNVVQQNPGSSFLSVVKGQDFKVGAEDVEQEMQKEQQVSDDFEDFSI